MEQSKQMVSPEPEILVRDRDNADEFVIIACDGIWDVMTNEECVAFVRDMVRGATIARRGPGCGRPSARLIAAPRRAPTRRRPATTTSRSWRRSCWTRA